ncbi:MAG: hypothetical protein ACKVQQ_04390 [Burkholderiales bacterium]
MSPVRASLCDALPFGPAGTRHGPNGSSHNTPNGLLPERTSCHAPSLSSFHGQILPVDAAYAFPHRIADPNMRIPSPQDMKRKPTMRTSLKAALAALALAAATTAQAVIVPVTQTGQWYQFDIDDLAATSGGVEWIDTGANFGEALSFSLTVTAPSVLRVVDAGFAGDRFTVSIDNGSGVVSSLASSAANDSFPDAVGDFDAAFANADFSRLEVILDPGTYTVTGELLAAAGGGAPLNVTTGALMLRVPEPGSLGLGALALALLAATRARRSRA